MTAGRSPAPGVTKCVLCLGVADTNEHIIPKAIGGGLELPVLCRNCNSTLGHSLDAEALRSGPVQEAALMLRDKVPWLWRSIGHNAEVKSLSAAVPMQIERGTGEPQVRPHQDAETGGVWRGDSEKAMKELRKSIRARIEEARDRGKDPDVDPDELIGKIKALEPGKRLVVDDIGMEFEKRQDKGIEIKLGAPLSRRYFARIGYFSLAIMGIDLAEPHLDIWRRFIRGEAEGKLQEGLMLGRMSGPSEVYLPHHEILVEHAAGEYYQADVALFGKLCWRCTFRLKRAPVVSSTAEKMLPYMQFALALDQKGRAR